MVFVVFCKLPVFGWNFYFTRVLSFFANGEHVVSQKILLKIFFDVSSKNHSIAGYALCANHHKKGNCKKFGKKNDKLWINYYTLFAVRLKFWRICHTMWKIPLMLRQKTLSWEMGHEMWNNCLGMSTSVCECEWGMWDWGKPEQMSKSGLFGIRLVKHTPSIADVFSLKYRLEVDSIRLFTEHSSHKRMLFAALLLHVHINISLISTCIIRHLRTDVDTAFHK